MVSINNSRPGVNFFQNGKVVLTASKPPSNESKPAAAEDKPASTEGRGSSEVTSPEASNMLETYFKATQGINSKKADKSQGAQKIAFNGSNTSKSYTSSIKKIAQQRNTIGKCYPAVADAVDPHMKKKFFGMSASDAAAQLAADPNFGEVTRNFPQSSDLKELPEGAIVVWRKGPRSPNGHISIALGDGREASDHIQGQITNYRGDTTGYRVFYPKNAMSIPSETTDNIASNNGPNDGGLSKFQQIRDLASGMKPSDAGTSNIADNADPTNTMRPGVGAARR